MSSNGETQTTTHDVEKVLERLGRGANAHMVYGEPIVTGEHAVIPVARVHYMGGGGQGSGTGPGPHASEESSDVKGDHESAGEGMGLGISVSARPVGAIDVTADSIHWSPTVDWSRIANIAAGVTGAIAVMFTARRLFRAS